MKKLIYFVSIVGVSLVMASCCSTKKAVCSASLNGEWNIVAVDGKPVKVTAEQPLPFIGFDMNAKRIYGNSGCNRMMGTFMVDSLKPGDLQFGPIAGTRMACPDMLTEQNVLSALENVNSFKVLTCDKKESTVSKIALCGKNGDELVIIEKKAVDKPLSLEVLNGEWLIKTVNGAPVGKSEKTPFIGFNIAEERVYGVAGCNNINGMLKRDENNPVSIDLGNLATTMMMCPDMETETVVLKALGSVKTFKAVNDSILSFLNAEGVEVMTLLKK